MRPASVTSVDPDRHEAPQPWTPTSSTTRATRRCAAAVSGWPRGRSTVSGAAATHAILETELISITELRLLFPDSEVRHERAAGLTTSIVAVR